MSQPGQVWGPACSAANALAPSNDRVLYLQWMPGSLTPVHMTGAQLAGILEVSVGLGDKLGSPFFHPALLHILSLSSPRCSFPEHKQGPGETARRVCVCALLLLVAASARTLFPTLSASCDCPCTTGMGELGSLLPGHVTPDFGRASQGSSGNPFAPTCPAIETLGEFDSLAPISASQPTLQQSQSECV